MEACENMLFREFVSTYFPTRPYGSVEGKYVGGEMLDWRRALQKTNRASTNSVKMIIINICDHLKLIMIIIPFQSLLSFRFAFVLFEFRSHVGLR